MSRDLEAQYTKSDHEVWIVYGENGYYSDYHCWVEGVHETEEGAQAHAAALRIALTTDNAQRGGSYEDRFDVVRGPWFRSHERAQVKTVRSNECDTCGHQWKSQGPTARCGVCDAEIQNADYHAK